MSAHASPGAAFLSERSATVKPFYVMDIVGRAAALGDTGRDVISLCVGQPSTGAPAAVVEALKDALDHEVLGYTPTPGTLQLRQTISEYYQRTYGQEVPVENIVVTTGSSGGFAALFLAACDAGDGVVLASPG